MPAPLGHPPYNKNGEGGRPRLYDEKYLEILADKLDDWIKIEDNLWIKYFFIENELDPNISDTFCERSERFRLAYKKAQSIQEGRIYLGSLKNKLNARMAEFGLMHIHGWATRSESKISGDASNPFMIIMNQTKELVDGEETDS